MEARVFRDLTGGRFYQLEDGTQLDQEGFKQASQFVGHIKQNPVSEDEQLASFSSQLIDKYETELGREATDEDLESFMTRADSESRQMMGLPQPGEAIQMAAPVEKRRTNYADIGNQEIKQEISKRLTPWKRRTRNDGGDNDQAFWIGKDIDGFKDKNSEIEGLIRDERGSSAGQLKIQRRMQKNHGYGQNEAAKEIQTVLNGGMLSARKLGVPNAMADEGLNLFLMQASGMDAYPGNQGDPIFATDHKVKIGSGPHVGVDSQRRMGERMRLGVLHSLPNIRRAELIYNRAGANEKLGDVLGQLREESGGLEDKLMQTLSYGKPSDNLRRNIDKLGKEYLISADMRGWTPTSRERDTFEGYQGPYNPTLSKSVDMYDLNHMRDELMNMRMQEFRKSSYDMEFDNGKLSMRMPTGRMQRFANTNLLDDGVMGLVQQMGKRFKNY